MAVDATGVCSCAQGEQVSGMIVRCPECKDRFQLSDTPILGSVKMVRCPSRGHAFFVGRAAEPEASADIGAGATEAADGQPTPPPQTGVRPAADGPASAASRAPSAAPVPGASIDPAALEALDAKHGGHGSKLVVRIVNTYLVSSRKLLSAIRDAVEAGDAKAFVSAAHTLVPSRVIVELVSVSP